MNKSSVAGPSTGSQAPQAFHDPIPGILEHGSVNLFAGASGVGKTCFLSSLLTSLQGGFPVLGHQVHTPTAIGYLCADRSWRGALYWLQKAGFPDIAFYSLADDPSFSPPRLRAKPQLIPILTECLDKLSLPTGALVVVDPLALFLGGNLLDYQNCAIALIELRRLTRKREWTLIGTAHASKQKGDKKDRYQRLQDRILGSSAQHGYGDTQMYLASPEETGERFFTFLWHPHTAPAETFRLGRAEDGLFVPWEQSPQRLEEDDLLGLIPSGPGTISFADLVEKAQSSRSSVHRRLQQLVQDGRVERIGHGNYNKKPDN